jgi:hypothetical protein
MPDTEEIRKHLTCKGSTRVRNFGIVTDIQTGPNGNLFLVSLTDGSMP